MRNKFTQTMIFTLLVLMTGCGGGSSNTDNAESVVSINSGAADIYDLVEYRFHDNLDTVGGSIFYETHTFNQDLGERLFTDLVVTEKYVKKDSDSIEKIVAANVVVTTFDITQELILETDIPNDNQQRTLNRFVSEGDTYVDNTSINGEYREKCTVVKHHDNLNLNTATNSLNIANGIYTDVLQVHCISGKANDGVITSLAGDVNYYLAKGIGIILASGFVEFIGDMYQIPQF